MKHSVKGCFLSTFFAKIRIVMQTRNIITSRFIILGLLTLLIAPLVVLADESKKDQTDQLQLELKAIEEEIAKYEQQLSSVKSEKNTLTKKINSLKIQQSKISLQIKQTNLNIENIDSRLETIADGIKVKEASMAVFKEQIVGLLRLVNKQDRYSTLDILVMQPSFGEFFKQLAEQQKVLLNFEQVAKQLAEESMALQRQRELLQSDREEQGNLIAIANLQNQQLAGNLVSQRDLLSKTKAEEENYQAILADKKKRAAEIRSRIYNLLGVSQNITFGEAVTIAQWAESVTGVRVAFLLAILTQESNLGKNVGTCNRLGDPPEKGWQAVMKPERDQEPFLKITEELGIDPDITPVSCPMKDKKGKQIGWGGAMGPAQFIPSTWIGYKDKVTAITGKTANPWDIRDAFLAAAILLKANGATQSGGEWAAAMRYFSGSTNTAYRFYGDNVIEIAQEYQQDIEDLNVD